MTEQEHKNALRGVPISKIVIVQLVRPRDVHEDPCPLEFMCVPMALTYGQPYRNDTGIREREGHMVQLYDVICETHRIVWLEECTFRGIETPPKDKEVFEPEIENVKIANDNKPMDEDQSPFHLTDTGWTEPRQPVIADAQQRAKELEQKAQQHASNERSHRPIYPTDLPSEIHTLRRLTGGLIAVTITGFIVAGLIYFLGTPASFSIATSAALSK